VPWLFAPSAVGPTFWPDDLAAAPFEPPPFFFFEAAVLLVQAALVITRGESTATDKNAVKAIWNFFITISPGVFRR
jgi:hypothetical protein